MKKKHRIKKHRENCALAQTIKTESNNKTDIGKPKQSVRERFLFNHQYGNLSGVVVPQLC